MAFAPSPATAGIILLINKLWDAVNDPLIGMLSDRIHTRRGAAGPGSSSSDPVRRHLLPPLPGAQPGASGKFWYYLIVSLALDIVLTVVNVPYTALTAEPGRDYDERTSLNLRTGSPSPSGRACSPPSST